MNSRLSSWTVLSHASSQPAADHEICHTFKVLSEWYAIPRDDMWSDICKLAPHDYSQTLIKLRPGHKSLVVHAGNPVIIVSIQSFLIDQALLFDCTSAPSRPAALLSVLMLSGTSILLNFTSQSKVAESYGHWQGKIEIFDTASVNWKVTSRKPGLW